MMVGLVAMEEICRSGNAVRQSDQFRGVGQRCAEGAGGAARARYRNAVVPEPKMQ
jgi:hypothetical protein